MSDDVLKMVRDASETPLIAESVMQAIRRGIGAALARGSDCVQTIDILIGLLTQPPDTHGLRGLAVSYLRLHGVDVDALVRAWPEWARKTLG